MPLLLLIRHGENDYVKKGRLAGRLPGVHLNEHGRQQAQAVADSLAARLAESPVKAIYSSPLERAIETAQPIAKALGKEIILEPGLIEVDIGEWQDKTLKSLRRLKVWKIVQGAPSRFHFPAGESFAEAQLRICSTLESLVHDCAEKESVICVSHSDPIRLAVAYFLGLPLDFFQRLQVSPASITCLQIDDRFSRLLSLNIDLSFTLPKA